jgi:hypothetical protein
MNSFSPGFRSRATRGVGSLVCLALVGACGAPDDKANESPEATPGGHDDAEVQAEVGRISQQLGEASCATTTADVTRTDDNQAGSHGATYDHPTCRDAFVIDAPGLVAGDPLYFQASVPVTSNVIVNFLQCGFEFSWFYVYEKQSTGYVLVSQNSNVGSIQGALPRTACVTSINLTVPRNGDYKIIAASRLLFGAKNDVSVGFR